MFGFTKYGICTWTWSYIVILQHQVGSKFIKCTLQKLPLFYISCYFYEHSIYMSYHWAKINGELVRDDFELKLGSSKIFGKVLEDQSRLSVNVSHGHYWWRINSPPWLSNIQLIKFEDKMGLGKGRNTWHSLTSPLVTHQDQAHLLCSLMKN